MSLVEILEQFKPDPWRSDIGFTSEIEKANQVLFNSNGNDSVCSEALNNWLGGRNQPCLFGRIAAKLGLISYCIINENDLYGPEEQVKKKIQDARLKWRAEGYYGEKSAFIIAVISRKIASAIPDLNAMHLAKRIGMFYLDQEIEEDQIYLDDIFFEYPTREKEMYMWRAGVNYFCSQGDKRWWQDHRIPGGMAFSVNSVGHMVKAGRFNNALQEIQKIVGEDWHSRQIDTLQEALEFAMRTIDLAAEGVSGRATYLLPIPQDTSKLPLKKCPVDLPKILQNKNYCEYEGFYDTDVTLPSEYFKPDINRPINVGSHSLDFTYLFLRDLDNPYIDTMGEGRRIREEGIVKVTEGEAKKMNGKKARLEKSEAKVVKIASNGLLEKALEKYPSIQSLNN